MKARSLQVLKEALMDTVQDCLAHKPFKGFGRDSTSCIATSTASIDIYTLTGEDPKWVSTATHVVFKSYNATLFVMYFCHLTDKWVVLRSTNLMSSTTNMHNRKVLYPVMSYLYERDDVTVIDIYGDSFYGIENAPCMVQVLYEQDPPPAMYECILNICARMTKQMAAKVRAQRKTLENYVAEVRREIHNIELALMGADKLTLQNMQNNIHIQKTYNNTWKMEGLFLKEKISCITETEEYKRIIDSVADYKHLCDGVERALSEEDKTKPALSIIKGFVAIQE